MVEPNKKLEAARLQRRWSVKVASEKVGVSVNTFNRWERGLQAPQFETLDQLCRTFVMSPDELGFAPTMLVKRRRDKASLQPTPAIDNTTTPTQTNPGVTSPLKATVDSKGTHPPFETLACLEQARRSLDDMNPVQRTKDGSEGVSRRKAVSLLISTPAAVLGLMQDKHPVMLHPEEILALSTVNIPLCWQLYFEGGFTELNTVLPGYLAPLLRLTQVPQYQKRAAHLTSQLCQLGYLLALQRQDFGTSLKYTQDAAHYGRMAENTDLQLAATVRQAYVYFCLQRSEQRLQTYEKAMQYQKGSSPLLQGYLYAGLAEAHAHRQEQEVALDYLKRAKEIFPEQPEADAHFSYTHFRWLTLYNLEGLVHLHLAQPQQAWKAFAKTDQIMPAAADPYRVEITVHKAATSLALNNMEQTCDLIERAATSAMTLGSSLRYNEACTIYEHMQEKWQHEPRVKALSDLFQRNIVL